MKHCKICGKSDVEFEPNRNTCKVCRSEYKINFYRTKTGHIKKMFNNQKRASILRGHSPPDYTLEKLTDWLINNNDFNILFNEWILSDYNKWKAPSLDRIDNTKGYSFLNLQIVTWKVNSYNAHVDCISGKLSTGNKHVAVNQYSSDGILINSYNSIRNAERAMGNNCHKEIINCCKGLIKAAKGYNWKYSYN